MRIHLLSLLLSVAAVYAVSAQRVWHDPLSAPQACIDGRGWSEELRQSYHRLPDRFQSVVRPAVWQLAKNSAGLYLNFSTTATHITVRYVVSEARALNNVVALAKSGVDLYRFTPQGQMQWCTCFGRFTMGSTPRDTIAFDYQLTAEASQRRTDGTMEPRTYRLYLPLYNTVEWMRIGVDSGEAFTFLPAGSEAPIVCYGTSILQGASASRPAMAWTNIVQRTLQRRVVNLGFSGNGLMEPELFDILAELPAACYVIDCMPNLSSMPDSIVPRLTRGVHRLRRTTQVPILLVEHDGYNNLYTDSLTRLRYQRTNKELQHAYRQLLAEGVKQLYYLGENEIGISSDEDSQIDGVHANDIGMRRYAQAVMRKLQPLLP